MEYEEAEEGQGTRKELELKVDERPCQQSGLVYLPGLMGVNL